MSLLDTLNPKHAHFVREYTLHRNGAKAARAAGFSEKSARFTASKLLDRPDVQAALAEREREMADQLGITHEWLLTQLKTIVETAMTPTPVLHQGQVVKAIVDGVEQMLTTIDAGPAVRALETLMKHRGMLVEQQEITVSGGVEYTLTLDSELRPHDIEDPPGDTP